MSQAQSRGDLQGPNSDSVVACRVLIGVDGLSALVSEIQKLTVDLNVMSRDLFVVALRMNAPAPTRRVTDSIHGVLRIRYTPALEMRMA